MKKEKIKKSLMIKMKVMKKKKVQVMMHHLIKKEKWIKMLLIG
jgi:hypothetical protein